MSKLAYILRDFRKFHFRARLCENLPFNFAAEKAVLVLSYQSSRCRGVVANCKRAGPAARSSWKLGQRQSPIRTSRDSGRACRWKGVESCSLLTGEAYSRGSGSSFVHGVSVMPPPIQAVLPLDCTVTLYHLQNLSATGSQSSSTATEVVKSPTLQVSLSFGTRR